MESIRLSIVRRLSLVYLLVLVADAHEMMIHVQGFQGENVSLPCIVVNFNSTDLPAVWFFKPSGSETTYQVCTSGAIINEFRGRFGLDSTSLGYQKLILLYAHASDSGIYICIPDGGRRQPTEVHVDIISNEHGTTTTISYDKQSKSSSELPVHAFQGDRVSVPCGFTNTNFTNRLSDWFFKASGSKKTSRISSAGIIINGFRDRFSQDTESVTGFENLIIQQAHQTDTGTYICIPNGGHGRPRIIEVGISYKEPNATGMTYPFFVGDVDAVFPCKMASLAHDVEWYYRKPSDDLAKRVYSHGSIMNGFKTNFRTDSSVPGERNLVILRVEKDNYGIYICASGEHKTYAHLQVFVASGDSSNIDQSCRLGETTLLSHINVRSSTSLSWWYRNPSNGDFFQISDVGHVYKSFGMKYSIDGSMKGDYSLTVHNAAVSDSGMYVCIDNLGNGFARRTTVKLTVSAAGDAPLQPTSVIGQLTVQSNDSQWALPIVGVMIIIVLIAVLALSVCRINRTTRTVTANVVQYHE